MRKSSVFYLPAYLPILLSIFLIFIFCESSPASWELKTPMPTARQSMAMAAYGGKIFAIGGHNKVILSVNEMYDPETDSWHTKAPMPTARNNLACAAANGKIYTIGGYDGYSRTNILQIYDIASNSWATGPHMPTVRNGVAAAEVNGKIYVFGGQDNSGYFHKSVEEFNPATNKWTTKKGLKYTRTYAFGCVAVNGKVYIIGGVYNEGTPAVATVEVYDPSTDTSVIKTPMPTARNSVFAGYISGKIYIIGGGIHPYGTFLDIVEAYDIQEDKWVGVDDPLPIARYTGGSATVGSKIFAIGGTEQNAPPETRSARVEVFTPDPGKFLLASPLEGYTPYTAPISSVFDHSMKGRPYDKDGINEIVVTFTGEEGNKKNGFYLDCYKNASGQVFDVNGNYQGITAAGPAYLCYDDHPGFDFSVSNQSVLSAAPGIVTNAGWDDCYGNNITIAHAEGYSTRYAHLSSLLVQTGDIIEDAQQEIGVSGNTGSCSEGDHLHFEVLKGGISVDPYGWRGCGNDPYTKATNSNLWAETIPSAPSCLMARPISSSQITLGWKDNSNGETGFKIERRTGNCVSSTDWKQVSKKTADTTTLTDSSLLPNTMYAYRLRAYNANGDSEYTICTSARTGLVGVPRSPVALKAISQSATQINLTWVNSSLDATEYQIYRKAGTKPWEQIAAVTAGTKMYVDAAAKDNTTTIFYSYYLKACNQLGCSPATERAMIPLAPTSLSAVPSVDSAKLKWTQNSRNEDGFQLFRKAGSCSEAGTWPIVPIAATAHNVVGYTDTDLDTGIYSYRVRAYIESDARPYAYGYSGYSNCYDVLVP